MIPQVDYFKRNVFLRQVESALSCDKLLQAFKRHNLYDPEILLLHGLIGYPGWKKNTDVFQFLHKKYLKKLRVNPKVFFIFDASTEGFSTIYGHTPFFDILYFNCKKYEIPPKKVIFISANMVEEQNLIRYNHEHKVSKSIHVACFNNFEQMLFGLKHYTKITTDYNDKEVEAVAENKLQEAIKETRRFYYGRKHFLSLSRVTRPHRILSAYELFYSDIFEFGTVSHGPLKPTSKNIINYHNQLPKNCGITKDDLVRFGKVCPLIADTEDFETNHALNLNSHLHNSTLFQIVGETFSDDCLGTSRFWSEKTFRSIFHLQPFIIWGQRGANKNLQDYGYKLYDKMFDYTFDKEQDDYKRWTMILKQVKEIVKKLNKMSKEKQLKWRFQQYDILKHNYKIMYKEEHTKQVFKDLASTIVKVHHRRNTEDF